MRRKSVRNKSWLYTLVPAIVWAGSLAPLLFPSAGVEKPVAAPSLSPPHAVPPLSPAHGAATVSDPGPASQTDVIPPPCELEGWTSFSNPPMRYDICYPPGFVVDDVTLAPTHPTSVRIQNAVLLSLQETLGGPFYTFEHGGIDIEIDLREPLTTLDTSCTPATPVSLNGGTGYWCVGSLDAFGYRDPDGPNISVVLDIEMQGPPDLEGTLLEDDDLSGSHLVVFARMSSASYEGDNPAFPWDVMDVLGTLHIY